LEKIYSKNHINSVLLNSQTISKIEEIFFKKSEYEVEFRQNQFQ